MVMGLLKTDIMCEISSAMPVSSLAKAEKVST
jgi:hypothetical protein